MSIITSASHDHPDHVALTIQIPGMSGSWTVYIPASDAADIAAARAVGDWPRQLAAAERGRAAMQTGRAFQEGAWPQTLALTKQAEEATAALILDISRPVKQRAMPPLPPLSDAIMGAARRCDAAAQAVGDAEAYGDANWRGQSVAPLLRLRQEAERSAADAAHHVQNCTGCGYRASR